MPHSNATTFYTIYTNAISNSVEIYTVILNYYCIVFKQRSVYPYCNNGNRILIENRNNFKVLLIEKEVTE